MASAVKTDSETTEGGFSIAAYLNDYAELLVAYTINLAISPARHVLDVVCVPIIVKWRNRTPKEKNM